MTTLERARKRSKHVEGGELLLTLRLWNIFLRHAICNIVAGNLVLVY